MRRSKAQLLHQEDEVEETHNFVQIEFQECQLQTFDEFTRYPKMVI